MNKIIYCIFLVIGMFAVTSTSYSQEKVFLISEDAYVPAMEYTDWNADNISGYSGKYEYTYPGYDAAGEYAGDLFQERILISFNGDKISVFKNLIVESDWEQNDTLKNASISANSLTATDVKGRFVTLKYNDKTGNVKYLQGLLLENPETKESSFYAKIKD